jgi:hypothetical protein
MYTIPREFTVSLSGCQVALKECTVSLSGCQVALKECTVSLSGCQVALKECTLSLSEFQVALRECTLSLSEFQVSLNRRVFKELCHEVLRRVRETPSGFWPKLWHFFRPPPRLKPEVIHRKLLRSW